VVGGHDTEAVGVLAAGRLTWLPADTSQVHVGHFCPFLDKYYIPGVAGGTYLSVKLGWALILVVVLKKYLNSIESLNTKPTGAEGFLTLDGEELAEYGPSLPKLKLTVSFETSQRLHVKITDATRPRWEIPDSILPIPGELWNR